MLQKDFLKHPEALLIAMMKNTKAGIACFNFPDLICLYSNPAFAYLTGLKPEQIKKKKITDIINNTDLHISEKKTAQLGQKIQCLFEKEFQFAEKNLSLSVEYILDDPKGKKTQGFILIINDNSARKPGIQEHELKNPQDLHISDKKHFALIKSGIENFINSEGAVFILDQQLKCIFASGKILEKMEFLPENITNKNLDEIFPPDISPLIIKQCKGVFENTSIRFYFEMNEHLYLNYAFKETKDNSGICVLITIDISDRKEIEMQLMKAGKKQEDYIEQRTRELEEKTNSLKESQTALVYLLEDVNETREELEVLNEKLLVANTELESFSYSVSHDLKAPLRAISGFSSLLLDNYAKYFDEEGKRMLNIVINSTHSMNELINDLLSFSRISRQEIRLTPVNIQQVAQQTFRETTSMFNNPNAELVFHEPIPTIMGDITMIKQLLINLISNALKFSAMREKACIELGATEKNKHIEYWIKDNGIGFNMNYVHKLFNVFQRLHSNTEFPGTGVGLAIVKRIALKHGGNVRAESKPGEGATFFFELKKPDII